MEHRRVDREKQSGTCNRSRHLVSVIPTPKAFGVAAP